MAAATPQKWQKSRLVMCQFALGATGYVVKKTAKNRPE